MALQTPIHLITLNFFQEYLCLGLHILQHDIPEVGIVDFQLFVRILTHKSALGERTGPIDQGVLRDAGVVLDYVIHILLEEVLCVVLLALVLKEPQYAPL